jgi:hypothetical protein
MGGGDGGAGDARKDEQDRQARIAASVSKINEIFDGKPVMAGDGQATFYDPKQAYFDKDGNPYTLPQTQGYTGGGGQLMANYFGKPAHSGVDANATMGLINQGKLFTGTKNIAPAPRQKLYDEQKQAVFDINKRDIDHQYQEAERSNRFGLARAGLMGGSADVDSNALLQRKTNEGLLKAGGLGDAAAADLKLSDERSRQGLIGMAQSGIDTGTAQTMALRNMDATQQQAMGARTGATIGGLFDGLGQAYMYGQEAKGWKAGMNMYDQKSPGSLSAHNGDQGTIIK